MTLAGRRWRRSEIALGMVLTKDAIEDAEPLLWRVVAICDEPTVVIEPLYEGDGEEREHFVISAADFAEFHQVRAADQPGAFSLDFGDP